MPEVNQPVSSPQVLTPPTPTLYQTSPILDIYRAASTIGLTTAYSVGFGLLRPQYGIAGAVVGYYVNKWLNYDHPIAAALLGGLAGGYVAFRTDPPFGSF